MSNCKGLGPTDKAGKVLQLQKAFEQHNEMVNITNRERDTNVIKFKNWAK